MDATGAVPHRSVHGAAAPWAPPGRYTVRLTVGGRSVTQPLTLRLDPRVKTPAAGLEQLAALSRETYEAAVAAHAAFGRARALVAALDSLRGRRRRGHSRRRSNRWRPRPGRARGGSSVLAPAAQPTLESASNALLGAAMAMQGADVAPTAAEVSGCERARKQSAEVMARWDRIRTTGLAGFNRTRSAAGLPPVKLPD